MNPGPQVAQAIVPAARTWLLGHFTNIAVLRRTDLNEVALHIFLGKNTTQILVIFPYYVELEVMREVLRDFNKVDG